MTLCLVLAFPAVLLSLGMFMLVINGVVVAIASWLYDPLMVSSFFSAMLAGVVIGLVNFLVGIILEDK